MTVTKEAPQELRARGRRRWLVLGIATAGVLAVVAAVALMAVPDRSTEPPPQRPGPQEVSTTGRGPAPPEKGVWIGAWASPTVYTQQGRVDAVTSFEQRIGRRLDVVNSFHDWEDTFPTPADVEVAQSGRTLMVSWSGTDTRVIESGRYDEFIRERARAVRDLGVPVLIRWRWEMDRPNLRASVWSPADYIAAWTRIRTIFTEEGATNAGWVWCPLANGFPSGRAQAYYPGDDQVDWLCADVYPGLDDLSFAQDAGAFLDWAADHPRPIVIGEFGAEAGDDPAFQADWLTGAAQAMAVSWQIRAAVYFEGVLSDGNAKGKSGFDYTLAEGSPGLAAFEKLTAVLADRPPRPSPTAP